MQFLSGVCALAVLAVAALSYDVPNVAGRIYGQGGVAIASGAFGTDQSDFSNARPGEHGVDYIYESRPLAYRSLRRRNHTLVRLAFRWERVQPQLYGPLRQREITRLRAAAAAADASGVRLILDMHNFGRYVAADATGSRELVLGSPQLPGAALADVWTRLSAEFNDDPGVVAYGLMNEPHDLVLSSCGTDRPSSACTWERASRDTVRAIRLHDDKKLVMVAGDSWSSAGTWDQVHPKAWIGPDLAPVRYEAHQYFDGEGRGVYRDGFANEQRRAGERQRGGGGDPLVRRSLRDLATFTEWLERHDAAGFIGEVGWPADDRRWNRVGAAYMDAAANAGLWVSYWSAGPWWGDYPLAAYEVGKDGRVTPRGQAQVIECYPTCAWPTGTSAHRWPSIPTVAAARSSDAKR